MELVAGCFFSLSSWHDPQQLKNFPQQGVVKGRKINQQIISHPLIKLDPKKSPKIPPIDTAKNSNKKYVEAKMEDYGSSIHLSHICSVDSDIPKRYMSTTI